MKKAIASKIKLDDENCLLAKKFRECIADLEDSPAVQKLKMFSQHMNTSRYQHSINVAYYSFLWAKKFGLDYRSAARGALLHDLFYYNFCESGLTCKTHTDAHPAEALENATMLFDLNDMEQDIIVKHMWPLTSTLPKYKESMLVTFADKYSAACEVLDSVFSKGSSYLFRRKVPQGL